jgi:uncharacterized protein involved in exopolysaccharide biosynthesis
MISKPGHVMMDQNEALDPRLEELDGQFSQERLLARTRLLWNDRRLLFRCGIAGLLAATLVAFLIPKRYESTAQLMPPDSQSPGSMAMLTALSGSGGLGMLAGDLIGVKSTGALFVGVLRSRTVQDRIVDRFDLKKVYGDSLQVRARDELAQRTAILEDRKSGIITITVVDHDPKRAAAIAGAYVEELNTLIAQVSTSSARRERIFLEDRLATVKIELEGAEKDFSEFASSKGAIDIPAQGKAMVEAAATLEGQLIAAESELEGLKQIYSDNNVRVRSTQARINELKQQLGRLSGTVGNSANDAERSPSNASYPTLRQLPILGVPFADKLRHMKVQEAVFETLTKQYELAKVQEAKEVPSVKILDAPVVPERKSFPPRLLIMFLGTTIAVICAAMWVLGNVHWKDVDSQDPRKLFAQEVFRTVAARLPLSLRNGHNPQPPAPEHEKQEGDRPRAKDASAGG